MSELILTCPCGATSVRELPYDMAAPDACDSCGVSFDRAPAVSDVELLGCPWCGARPSSEESGENFIGFIMCNNDDCAVQPECDWDPTAWNTRAQSDEVGRLRAVLELVRMALAQEPGK